MTVGEAAKYLGVGRKVIYQMIEFDQIRAVRENRAVLIEKRSLDDFRASGQLTWFSFRLILEIAGGCYAPHSGQNLTAFRTFSVLR